ncbi:MAG TPA: hypothetical protein VHX38_29595 [Pseudonocardiaceae bacterium]|jgi:hypothetical protein|nr:hypothetical protein [Pseudonocardiaceae bacterium]
MTTYRLNNGRSTAAGLMNLVGSVLALILVAHIVFESFHIGPANRLVTWVGSTSDVISLWFAHLIDTGNATFSLVLNYGLAAVFWLIVTGVIASLLRSVG